MRLGEPVKALDMHLWVLTHPALRHTARVKALMRILAEALAARSDLFVGRCPRGPDGR